MLILNPDDLGLDWWSRVRYWGFVRLAIKVRLLRRREALPWVKGRVLLWLSIAGVMRSLLGVLLWRHGVLLPVVWWCALLLGVLLWFSIAGVMRSLLGVLLWLHGVLLPVMWWCALLLGHSRADDWPRRDDWSAWDRVPPCCWRPLVGCWWVLIARPRRLPSRPRTSWLLAMLLLQWARGSDVPGLLAVIAHSVCSGCRHQRAFDDVVGVISDVQVRGKVGAEVIDDSLQYNSVCWCRRSAPNGAGGLLVAECIVG